ncbi:hypothetical protein SASPL_128420 [Salvia splendens]|uniref:Protein kinase domain-containing protein n=1 Tax=Salvia splendens TaxID=180675 RepID=A0A8X8XCG1_SALSN|nr:hypothetical protein SASPL_128420 [Salvia splendens]
MAVFPLLLFLLPFHLHLFKAADSTCPQSFECGNYNLTFPFTKANDPGCGLITVVGCGSNPPYPMIHFGGGNLGFSILKYNLSEPNKMSILDYQLDAQLKNRSCFAFMNQSMLRSPSISLSFSPNITLFPCFNESSAKSIFEEDNDNYRKIDCLNTVYYKIPGSNDSPPEQTVAPDGCSLVQLPMSTNSSRNLDDLFSMIAANFTLEWNVSDECLSCFHVGGQCLTANNSRFYCKRSGNQLKTILLATLIPGFALLVACIIFIIWQRKKKMSEAYLLSRNLSYDPSSKLNIEDGSFSFDIPIFSYTELVEAADNFDPSKELGDGGFGTVYYGKLRDGREVAIKRLYENNYRREEQFLNEIKILTNLRHPNLVSLYGCTSPTGYNSDAEVTRMTTSVAELAFQCLQLDKDMRPSMEEVVAFLHDIQSGRDCDIKGKIPPSPEMDDVVLLKSGIYQQSPTAVTDTWISSDSTTASSVC